MTHKEWKELTAAELQEWLLFMYKTEPRVAEAVDTAVARMDWISRYTDTMVEKRKDLPQRAIMMSACMA